MVSLLDDAKELLPLFLDTSLAVSMARAFCG